MRLNGTALVIGSYNETSNGYQQDEAIFASTSVSFLLSIIFVVWAVGQYFKNKNKYFTANNFYINAIFRGWDYGISSKNSSELEKRLLVKEIEETIAEVKFEEDLVKNIKSYRKVMVTRVVFSICTVIIVLTNWLIVWSIKNSKNSNLKNIPFLPATTVWIVTEVSSLLFGIFSKYEKYPKHRDLLITLLRNLTTYLTSLAILVYLELKEPHKPADKCWENSLAEQMYSLIIASIGSEMLFSIRTILSRLKAKKPEQFPEIKTDKQALYAIKMQTISWIGLHFAPLISFVTAGALLIVALVNIVNIFLLDLKPKTMFRASRAKFLFVVAIQVNMWITVMLAVYILFTKKPSGNCPPYSGCKTIYESLSKCPTDPCTSNEYPRLVPYGKYYRLYIFITITGYPIIFR